MANKITYNTTVQLNNSELNNDQLEFNSPDDYFELIKKFSLKSNLLLDESWIDEKVVNSIWAGPVKKQQNDWFCYKLHEDNLSEEQLSKLDSYIRSFFTDPIAYYCTPLVDMLYLTVKASKKCVKYMNQQVKTMPDGILKLYKTGTTAVLKNYHDKYQYFAKFKSENGAQIDLYWGLHKKVSEKRPNQRLLKLTVNPARHSRDELEFFFSWLRSVLGDSAKTLLKKANVTRIDIALDIPGVKIQHLLIDRPGVSKRGYTNKSDDCTTVGTQKFGAPDSSCSHAYDKMKKLSEKGPEHIPLLLLNHEEMLFYPIARAERVHRPADTTAIALWDIEGAPFFLKSTEFYSPNLLNLLNDEQKSLIKKYGFSYWLHNIDKNSTLNANTLAVCKLTINEKQLKIIQRRHLIQLKKIIIGE